MHKFHFYGKFGSTNDAPIKQTVSYQLIVKLWVLTSIDSLLEFTSSTDIICFLIKYN